MTQENTETKFSDASIDQRIQRLRSRLKQARNEHNADPRIVAILQGILDLLSDELWR